MSRSTIDFGIDLGTTNSAIAVLEGIATEIIKNSDRDADITPSAVSIDKNATIQVGERAKSRMLSAQDDAYGEFKRGMGTDRLYEFKSGRLAKRPEELSAEVLKVLCGAVQQRKAELVEAAVITVPAAFELHQCDATRAAAQLAGLNESPLLQEPVAAALSYGFQVNKNKAYWLVYDFGGGTFDAAVMKCEEGIIHVVNHGGDNFLGGSDIDWAIVNQVLVPRLLSEHKLPDFARGNDRWRAEFAKLKHAAEGAKIVLSRNERITLYPEDFGKLIGADREELEFECEVTRADVIRAAEPFIQRSIDICQRVLKEKNLGKAAIEKVILVGGPTLAPYFRDLISDGLGIAVDYSVDPLTVVARGAAIFAGTQRLHYRGRSHSAASGQYSIDLKYQPVGIDSAPTVGGTIAGSSSQDFSGFTLELVNVKTKWSSGKMSLPGDGVFVATLHAERGERNTFSIVVLDPRGRKLKTSPDVLTYTIGATVGEQTLINSMGIALADNKYDKLLEKGRGLPVKAANVVYLTVRPIRRGQSEDVCKINVVEGEHKGADRNRLVGSLEIKGEKISRDLPVGSEVEVTLQIDESRIITIKAYVPVLNEEFSATPNMGMHSQDVAFLQRDFDAEMGRIREVKAKAGADGGKTAESLIHSAEQSPLMEEVKQLLAGGGDPDKCERRLLELKIKLDEAVDALEWPALVSEAREWLGALKAVDTEHSDSDRHKRAAELTQELQTLMRNKAPDDLRAKIAQVRALWWEITSAQPAYWVYQLQELEKQIGTMREQARAARLFGQGRAFMSHGNAVGLENVVRDLWRLLPEEAVEETRRGYQAGIVKVAGN